MKNAINYSSIFKIAGHLLLIESAMLLIPALVCAIYGERDWTAFLPASGTSCAAGALLSWSLRHTRISMGKREGYLLTALMWILFSLFGMIPLMLCRHPLGLTDAFFETMSGFTTTGATVIRDVEVLSHGILLWRAMIQWLGGLGIILFILAVVPSLNQAGGLAMFNAEITGVTHDKIHPRIRQTALSLWYVYLCLTMTLAVLLWAGPMNLFDSVCQSLATVSTGGFSTRNGSIADWNSDYADLVIAAFMAIGGINFMLIYGAAHGNFRRLLSNDVFKAYIAVLGAGTIMYAAATYASEGSDGGFHSLFVEPVFQVVSSVTTTGFSVGSYERLGSFIYMLTALLMVCGACAGSTTGAVKIDRMLALHRNLTNEVRQALFPRRIYTVEINGRILSGEQLAHITAFIVAYMALVACGTLAGCVFGMDMSDSLFSTLSCIGNNGLGWGMTGAEGSFALLPDALKWIMSLLMMTGRLELFTVLVLFLPEFWRR